MRPKQAKNALGQFSGSMLESLRVDIKARYAREAELARQLREVCACPKRLAALRVKLTNDTPLKKFIQES